MRKVHKYRQYSFKSNFPRVEHYSVKVEFTNKTYEKFKEYTESMHYVPSNLETQEDTIFMKFKYFVKESIEK